jgi:hypothetical protein
MLASGPLSVLTASLRRSTLLFPDRSIGSTLLMNYRPSHNHQL